MNLDLDVVVKAGIALLAFVLAFYGLMSRARKAPYLTRTVYWSVLVILASLLFALISLSLRPGVKSEVTAFLSSILLLFAFVLVIVRVFSSYNRDTHFRDDRPISNLRPVRFLKNRWRDYKRAKSPKPTYEHNPIAFSDTLLEAIQSCSELQDMEGGLGTQPKGLGLSLSAVVPSFSRGNKLLAELTATFLGQGGSLQYTTCVRHPYEFLAYLHEEWEGLAGDHAWETSACRVVCVDAYTSHFGFTDSIHRRRTADLVALGVECITCRPSYAGIHSETAKAFNILKKKCGDETRKPTLMIYEGPKALVDLESLEQYHIFLRHVLGSERMWGGMLTVFIESAGEGDDLTVLRSYSDGFLSLKQHRQEGC